MVHSYSARLLPLGLATIVAACTGDDTTTGATDTASSSVTVSTAGTAGTAGTTTAGTSTTNGTGTASESDVTGVSVTVTTTMGTTDATTATTDVTTTDATTATTDVTTTDATTMGTTDATMGTTDATMGTTDTTMGTTGVPCVMGTVICEDNTAKVCDGMGGFSSEDPCADECLDGVGCVLCVPGSTQCNGPVVQTCNDQGDAWVDGETCDGIQGLMCDPDAGQCVGACAGLGLSYIGCDYYPTVTAGLHETNPWVFDYAVVIANTTNVTANITITRGANTVKTDTVNANTAKVITLPYVNELLISPINTAGPTVKVTDGAYRLRSDRPVTVYQYNPLQYKVNNSFSYINDASLLLPVNTWANDYRVVSRNHWPFAGYNLPGFYAVIASKDGTTVTLTPSATGGKVFAGAGIAANGTGQVMLNEGDVLEVFTVAGGGSPDTSDLTGTLVSADKPVQVIGGHKCTNVPYNVQFCDRLEESIPPIDTLSKEYIVTTPLITANQKKGEMVRIVATEADTNLTYDPPQGGAPAKLVNAGDWAEIAQTQNDFQITADKKILVAQYMLGQNAGGNSGDPAMTLAVANDQFRTQYLVHAPTNYDTSFANLVAPTGANITLDGNPVGGFTAIGGTGYGVARVSLSNAGDGNHLLTGDQPFGIQVYGYGQYTSYWYPGGLNLEVIPQ